MMKTKILILCFLLGSAFLSADWTRRADIQGNITDVAVPDDKSEVYISTDGAGVWWWNGGQWVERNSGLEDLRIRALVVRPDNPAILKAAAVSGQVFMSMDYGASWTLDSTGLGAIADAFVPTDLSMAWDDAAGQWYTYMATLGGGVLRQGGSGLWVSFNTGLTNMDILSVAACSMPSTGGHRVLAGSRFNADGFHPGNLYRYDFNDNWWAPVNDLPSTADYSVPSIAFHQEDLAMAALTVGQDGAGHGLYYTTDLNQVTWSQVCSRPPDHSFLSVDYTWASDLIITAGTPFGLVHVDPPWDCGASPYQYFCGFRGAVTSIGLVNGNVGVAGGPGKGPVGFEPSNPLICPMNRRQGLQDNNILDIAVGPFFGTGGGDTTIFTASGIAGVYKNWDPISPGFPPQEGYFYRMIGDPASWGIPPILRIRPVPNYNESGCRPNRTVFAATNGSGVLRSFDGGRSWEYANGGSPILGGGVVADIAFHPQYDGFLNTTLWAAVYGRGVFESQDNGDSWAPKGSFTNFNPRVLCLAAAWDSSQSQLHLFAGCRAFNLSVGQNTFFKWNGDSWSPMGGLNLPGKSVSVIGLPPAFPSPNWILVGTEAHGVWASGDGGLNFIPISTGLPGGNVYLNEDFSGGIPSSWGIVQNAPPDTCQMGPQYTWNTTDYGSRNLQPPLATPYAIVDSDNQGSPCAEDEELITPVLDTSAAASLTLKFDHFFRYYPGGPVEHGYVKVRSSATGGTWVLIADFTGQDYGPETVTLDVAAFRGTMFQVSFHYTGSYDWWWAVDNVLLGDGLGDGARIFDLQLGPYFNYPGDTSVLAAVRPTGASDGGVYFTDYNHGWEWTRIVNGLPDARILSVAFSPQYFGSGTVFCGHVTQGLSFAALDPAQPSTTTWQSSTGFFNIPPDVTGLAVSPDDPDTVFASTLHDGVFISRDGGDSFQPWGGNLYYDGGSALCPVQENLSVAVTHQTPPSPNIYLQEDFSVFPPSGWEVWDEGATGPDYQWALDGSPCDRNLEYYYPGLFSGNYPIIDSDCQGLLPVDDWLVTPAMDTSSAQRVLLQFNHYFRIYEGTEHGYIKVCSSATGGNCSSPSGNWTTAADFTGTDVLARSTLDLTPWKGTNFRVAFHYVAFYQWYWAVDDVEILQLLPRVVVGTKDHGIRYADAGDSVYFGTFLESNLTSGTVNELRYDGMAEDMRASHIPDGDYSSINYGQTWTLVPGVTPGLGLTDVSYPSGVLWGRGKTSFVWGCSSGKTVPGGRGLGDGRAWYYNPLYGAWQQCPQSGLNNGIYEDFRAVLELNSGTVLMGSIGTGSGGSWQGVYRAGSSCASWTISNEGLPPNAKVYAFQQDAVQGFVLAAVVDSDPAAPDYGGVYYSDTTSDGRAWAKTNLPSPAPSSRELAATVGGINVYAGLSGDGVFSTGSGSIAVPKPTAYFEVAGQACVGQAVQFYNYSAGIVTGNDWAFGDGQTSTLANPTNTYATAATYYPELTVCNDSDGDCENPPPSPEKTDLYVMPSPGLTIHAELDLAGTLRAVKSGSNVILSWTDLNQGETGYQVWASNSKSSGAPYGAQLGPDATSATVTGYTYWRIQPKSTSHICGDGPVGGSW
jgi:hypothetical protein